MFADAPGRESITKSPAKNDARNKRGQNNMCPTMLRDKAAL
jgi:hypothetical protein